MTSTLVCRLESRTSYEEMWAVDNLSLRSLGLAKGDVAVVTSAGDGIGRSAVLMLARPGITVAAWDTEEEAIGASPYRSRDMGIALFPC